MTILFAAGDIGGARALLPVMQACTDKRLAFLLLAHGHLPQEAPEVWPRVPASCTKTHATMRDFFKAHDIDWLVFASSVHDSLPLKIARAAKTFGLQVMHVLDNWSGYRRRLEMDGYSALMPDVYTVMDTYAWQAASQDGVAPSILALTGQPALATLADQVRTWTTDTLEKKRRQLGVGSQTILLVFVSEPVAQDQGVSPANPAYRGYTEADVLQLFCRALQPFAERVEIALLPHPRQRREDLAGLWHHCRGTLRGELLADLSSREVVWLADGVVGMASILLYEAWLLGKPVLSLQPGLRQDTLRMLQTRQGVVFVESYAGAEKAIGSWMTALEPKRPWMPRSDLALHRTAPETIRRLLTEGKRTTV